MSLCSFRIKTGKGKEQKSSKRPQIPLQGWCGDRDRSTTKLDTWELQGAMQPCYPQATYMHIYHPQGARITMEFWTPTQVSLTEKKMGGKNHQTDDTIRNARSGNYLLLNKSK